MGGTSTGVGPVGASGGSWLDRGTKALVCSLPPSVMNTVDLFNAAKVNMEPRRKGNSAAATSDFEARYGIYLQIGPINVDADIARARKMSHSQLFDAVRTGGQWDFKNRKEYVARAGGDKELRDLLQEFGNFYFGLIFAARGIGLYTAAQGAGAYQVTFQSYQRGKLTGSPAGMLLGLASMDLVSAGFSAWAYYDEQANDRAQTAQSYIGSNSRARRMIGCYDSALGDNPGDSAAIMRGWDFFFLRQGYAPPP